MLSLLDHNINTCYRVPLDVLSTNDPYVLAAYLASLRFSTRFNEVTGTLTQYIEYYGAKVDAHVGCSIDRMRRGFIKLCELGYFDCRIVDARALGPKQGIYCKFNPNKGWRYDIYPLSVLFTIREIQQAIKTAKGARWTGVDGLIDILFLAANLRSQMDTTTESINPAVRFKEAAATVDFESTRALLDISEKKLLTRLNRMRKAGLGMYQIVTLENPSTKKKTRMILAANKSNIAPTILTRAKKNLKEFYQGFTLTTER